jgi:hypothetical protein
LFGWPRKIDLGATTGLSGRSPILGYLRVDAVAFIQTMEVIPTPSAALFALDVERVELADHVAKDHRAVAGHNNPPLNRNARSICAVAASTSLLFPVSAALSSGSAAKSQCGRA